MRPYLAGIARPILREAHGALALGLAAVAVVTIGAASRTMLAIEPASASAQISAAYVPSSDSWFDQLSNPQAWRSGRFRQRQRTLTRAEEREERLREQREEREERLREEREAREERLRDEREAREEGMERAREFGRERGTYRTVCVRLCDGYFFPISFATTPDRFAADEALCRSRCASSAKLYVYPNPGGEPEQMTDTRGQPYTALKTAFLFRTNYDAGCTCKPHPWDEASQDRHRAYAERAQSRKRSVTAKVQTEPTPTLAISPAVPPQEPTGKAQRPAGAMLVGASDPKPPKVAEKSQPKREARSSGGRHGYGDRSDWRNRAFSGD